jgi:tetratricopeptide (TPR) repeat protein
MQKGEEALGQGNLTEAEHIANRLQGKGYESAAHILRGKVFLSQAKVQLENAPPPFPYEGMQRAAQMVLSSAGITAYPSVLHGPGWLAGIQVQQPFRRQIPGVGNLLEALAEFTQVLDNDPWAAKATVLASECLVRLGDYRTAELALTTLVERQPDNLDAHRYLAAIYVDVNARTAAAPHLREWIRLDANDPHPYRWLSNITRNSEIGYPEAIEANRKLLQLNLEESERAAVANELAEIQIDTLAEYEQALDTLAKAPQSFQDHPSYMLLRAECLLGLGQVDEARRLVDGLLKKHPTFSGALLFRAKIYLQDDKPQSAIALLEKLLALQSHNSRAREALMLAYQSIGDERRVAEQKQLLDALPGVRKRINELERVVAREPWNGRARLEMANLQSGINHSEALAWIRFAFASSPEDPQIRRTWTQLVGYQPPPVLRDFQRRRQGRTD